MSQKINIREMRDLLANADDFYLIRATRTVCTAFHVFLSAINKDTNRNEAWYLNSEFGAWAFFSKDNKCLLSNDVRGIDKIDEFFAQRKIRGNVIIQVENDGALTFLWEKADIILRLWSYNEANLTKFDPNIEKTEPLWVLEQPDGSAISMRGDGNVYFYSPQCDPYHD